MKSAKGDRRKTPHPVRIKLLINTGTKTEDKLTWICIQSLYLLKYSRVDWIIYKGLVPLPLWGSPEGAPFIAGSPHKEIAICWNTRRGPGVCHVRRVPFFPERWKCLKPARETRLKRTVHLTLFAILTGTVRTAITILTGTFRITAFYVLSALTLRCFRFHDKKFNC